MSGTVVVVCASTVFMLELTDPDEVVVGLTTVVVTACVVVICEVVVVTDEIGIVLVTVSVVVAVLGF